MLRSAELERPSLRERRLESNTQVQRVAVGRISWDQILKQFVRVFQRAGQFSQPPRTLRRGHISWYSNHYNPPVISSLTSIKLKFNVLGPFRSQNRLTLVQNARYPRGARSRL